MHRYVPDRKQDNCHFTLPDLNSLHLTDHFRLSPVSYLSLFVRPVGLAHSFKHPDHYLLKSGQRTRSNHVTGNAQFLQNLE